MSYEPRLIIRENILFANEDKINAYVGNEKNKRWPAKYAAYEELCRALKEKRIVFPEIALIIIRPELTGHNKKVRELMDELGIDYRTAD